MFDDIINFIARGGIFALIILVFGLAELARVAF